ncbi:flotillin family protein [Deinococcus pimensis]|uniref:flotillin family protein n=1 Tax=Deinococcus pimensis TaxID=309888 RepID=UPI001FE04F10|nr:SPFH domain-containing protein [Deinococcus pimensis]
MEVLILAGIVVVAVVLVLVSVQQFLIVVPPNKLLVISGRSRKTETGDSVGFRVIRGGRAFRVPVLERVSWMDLTAIPLELTVHNAYSRGGIPLNVHAVANVKINSNEPFISNAIERFLDMPRADITQIIKDTLEGNLRGVIAQLTPEEINEDRLKFAENLIEEAEHDTNKLGVQLDTLKIQNVSDDGGYLDSIGRRRTAEVLKDARIAEAERNAEASEAEAQAQQRAKVAVAVAQRSIIEEENRLSVRRVELEAQAEARKSEVAAEAELAKVRAQQTLEQQRLELDAQVRAKAAETNRDAKVAEAQRLADAAEAEAASRQRTEVARAAADGQVIEAQNGVRVRRADLEGVARSREAQAEVAAEQARVQAQQALEAERVRLNERRYEADVVAPARAEKTAALLRAEADAAPITEEGRAKAEAFRLMLQAFREAGDGAERAYVLSMLPGIVEQLAGTVRGVNIDKLSVIDSGSGQGFQSALSNMPRGVINLVEQVETATGVQLLSALRAGAAAPETVPIQAADD